MKFWDKGFTLETKHWWWLYISEKMKFPIDLHIKAYHLNHWLLSLYGFKYLHYSVTLSSLGWNPFPWSKGLANNWILKRCGFCSGKGLLPMGLPRECWYKGTTQNSCMFSTIPIHNYAQHNCTLFMHNIEVRHNRFVVCYFAIVEETFMLTGDTVSFDV